MALLFELLSTTIIWVTRPCILFKWACLFGLRTAFIFAVTCTELAKVTIYLHISLLYKMLVWTVAFLTLPFRVLTAISRETQLETQVRYMKSELESLLWDRKALQRRLQSAIKEHKMLELILEDFEAEHDKAIAKIELLQDQLRELRKENLRLNEVHGKDYWAFSSKANSGNGHTTESSEKYGASWKTSRDRTDQLVLELLRSDIIEHRRETAIGESLFSALLSLFVGVVIWEAEEPCTPLVAALFAVVTISLKSVVEFFSAVKTKHASDAALLLSLNCFLLGALTYPTLPGAARILGPLSEKAMWLIGLSSSSSS